MILPEVAARRGGPPHRVRSGNGPEFAADAIRSWLDGAGSGAWYAAPASPWQNVYAESFYSKLRDEFLDREQFEGEPHSRALGVLWKEEDNTEWPHGFPGSKIPAEDAARCERYRPVEETPTELSPDEQPQEVAGVAPEAADGVDFERTVTVLVEVAVAEICEGRLRSR